MKKLIQPLLLSSTMIASAHSQWVQQNSGIIFTLFSVSAVDNDNVWACSSGPNILKTSNGGDTWVNIGGSVPQPYGVETTIFGVDANTALFACYAGNPTVTYVYKTTNAGSAPSRLLAARQGRRRVRGIPRRSPPATPARPRGTCWACSPAQARRSAGRADRG